MAIDLGPLELRSAAIECGTSFVSLPDKAWFDLVAARSGAGCLNEVNFYQPNEPTPMTKMSRSQGAFFRLEKPDERYRRQGSVSRAASYASALAPGQHVEGDVPIPVEI